jgi:hypothetical protein
MPISDLIPAVAGRAFYCTDRLAPPDELVTAETAVPGHAQLWVVRAPSGHRFMCDRAHLWDVPPAEAYRALQDAAFTSRP